MSNIKLGGNRHSPIRIWAEIEDRFGDLLPPYPGASNIKVAKLPAPPLVSRAHAEPRAAAFIALWYRSAIDHTYGNCRVFNSVEQRAVLATPHYPALINAIPLLLEHHIAPGSWTAFSATVWQRYAVEGRGAAWDSIPSKRRAPKRGMPPPPKWVFSLKRLEERTDWFAWHEARFRGGRLHVTEAHKALIACFEELKLALLTLEKEPTRLRVQDLVLQYLPPARYQRLKDKAEDEAEWQQTEWNDQVKKGVWLW